METQAQTITIGCTVNAPVEKAWTMYNTPSHVTQWNSPSPDWHTPHAENDFRSGGTFNYRMEAKDGSFGFDFAGTYDEVRENEYFHYTLGDGRKVEVTFQPAGDATEIVVKFEPETQNPLEFQKSGWQAILDNYKHYTETH
jgi:uncharacterized protein YndB with AHSA1/START domain